MDMTHKQAPKGWAAGSLVMICAIRQKRVTPVSENCVPLRQSYWKPSGNSHLQLCAVALVRFYRIWYGTEPHTIQNFLIWRVLATALECLGTFHSPVTTLCGPRLTQMPEAGRHTQQGTNRLLSQRLVSGAAELPVFPWLGCTAHKMSRFLASCKSFSAPSEAVQ